MAPGSYRLARDIQSIGRQSALRARAGIELALQDLTG